MSQASVIVPWRAAALPRPPPSAAVRHPPSGQLAGTSVGDGGVGALQQCSRVAEGKQPQRGCEAGVRGGMWKIGKASAPGVFHATNTRSLGGPEGSKVQGSAWAGRSEHSRMGREASAEWSGNVI